MRVVLDANVIISALFFAGLPGRILAAWIDEQFEMLASVEIDFRAQRYELIWPAS
jgi:predicted nucleic acid-binding protein